MSNIIKSKTMKSIYVFLLMVSMSACTSLKKSVEKKNTVDHSIKENKDLIESKIIFLNYKATKGVGKIGRVSLINKIITKGNLKKNIRIINNKTKGDFLCFQLDQNSLPLDSLQIPNPLIKNIEYVQSSGRLGRKRIELDSATFNVRMQLHPLTKFISIKPNTSNETLLKTKL